MHVNMNGAITKILKSLAAGRGVKIYELDVQKIIPRQSVRLKCQVPLCEYYDVCRVCPPHIPGVDVFREVLRDYSRAFLVVYREKVVDIGAYRTDFTAELRLAEAVAELEFAAFQHGWYQAIGLCVGGCKFCPECAPPGEPCRHPFKARPSPEGFGIDVTELAREAGVPVEWPPAEYVSFIGLLLI